jgi:hypothetical protein
MRIDITVGGVSLSLEDDTINSSNYEKYMDKLIAKASAEFERTFIREEEVSQVLN